MGAAVGRSTQSLAIMQNSVAPGFGRNKDQLLVVGAFAHAIVLVAWWLADDREVTRELWTAFGWAWLLWIIALGGRWKRLPLVDRALFAVGTGVAAASGGLVLWNTAASIKVLFS